MATQYIYLLQEREFVNSKQNVYKIGMTCQENHKRFNQYKKGSILLFQIICTDCRLLEKNIIKIFKEKFKQRKEDAGSESFEGDFKHMIDIIYRCVHLEQPTVDLDLLSEDLSDSSSNSVSSDSSSDSLSDRSSDSSSDSPEEMSDKDKYDLICMQICKIFPDYKNDKSFTGNKKYIKLSRGNEFDLIYYINPSLKNDLSYHYRKKCKSIFCDHIIRQYTMDDRVADELQYFRMLIDKNIICRNQIYDIKLVGFTKKINRTKFNLKMETGAEFDHENSSEEEEIDTKLRHLFHCNMIIKPKLYGTLCKENDNIDIFKQFKKLKNFSIFRIDVGIRSYEIINLYKINSKFYYYTYLLKYLPYQIISDFYGNYYILNREYEFIGLNTKSIKFEVKNNIYIFNDYPWHSQDSLSKMYNKYLETCKGLKVCLNKNKLTDELLASLMKK